MERDIELEQDEILGEGITTQDEVLFFREESAKNFLLMLNTMSTLGSPVLEWVDKSESKVVIPIEQAKGYAVEILSYLSHAYTLKGD